MTAQTFTLRDVAIAAHTKHGMDTTAAETIALTYLDQIEKLEDRSIDEDDLTADDFDFLLGAIDSARRAGDLGLHELDTVTEAAQDMEDKAQALEHSRVERDATIRAAVHAGARIQDVAAAAGISRQAVDKIIRA